MLSMGSSAAIDAQRLTGAPVGQLDEEEVVSVAVCDVVFVLVLVTLLLTD